MECGHQKLVLASAVVGLSCVGWAFDYYVAPGATGICRVDDPGDLTACVNEYATSVGDVIHLAPGTYELNGCLGVKPGVALIGDLEHAEDTVLKQTATGDNVRVLYLYGGGSSPNTLRNLTITGGYTIYQGGGVGNIDEGGFYTASNCAWKTGLSAREGCKACVDPKFAGAAGVFSPYELRAGSPCRDAGARLAWMDEPEAVDAKDVAGNARVVNDVIDIGAFEFDDPVSTWIFVW